MNASSSIPPTAPPMVAAQMPPAPVSQPPAPVPPPTAQQSQSSIYQQTVAAVLKGPEFTTLDQEQQREKIGEEIYNYVLTRAGEESAPKITGMIIDLPFNDLMTSVQTYEGLQEKIQEGLDLLESED